MSTSMAYSGFVSHLRHRPKKHLLKYRVFYLLLNLGDLGILDKKLKLFSYNRPGVFSFYDIDHGPRDGTSLLSWVFKTLKKADIDIEDGRGGFNWMSQYIGENIGKLYKNINDKVSINETEFMGRFFLLTDPLEEQKWKMTGESKKIGKYTCYKATYEKEVEEATFSFGNFNQAQNTPKKKKMKKVNVVAWFTPEIPIATGPSRYGGLPGLILEVSDDQTTLLCTKIVMNPTDKVKIKKPKKGKIIATSDFLVLQDEKRIEAREMWQKRRASGSTARLNR